MSECALRVHDLRHTYGSQAALNGVTFEVDRGAIFGLIGPNGAGKTTLLRIMATLIEPSSGSVEIEGVSIADDPDRARRTVGYMSDQAGVYERLSVQEYLEFFAEASGLRAPSVVEAALELTDLHRLRDKLVSTMSKGMKQRLQVARVLINDPAILLLDEPASDLDPRARIELRDLLAELQAMGKTILLSSHILSDLAELCTSVAILDRGTLVDAGTMDDIRARLTESGGGLCALRRVKLRVLGDPAPAVECLRQHPSVRSVDKHPQGHLLVSYEGDERAAASVARMIVMAGMDLLSFEPERSDLERLFLEATRGELQ